jgi:alkanesulfonate monooxygenase
MLKSAAANQRLQQLAREHGDLLVPHLWTGIIRVRSGTSAAGGESGAAPDR